MSNHLAIATVTETLHQQLETAARKAVEGTQVNAVRPEERPGGGPASPEIRIFLFQVTPHAALRNADLPTRRLDGTTLERPTAALDLHYLFSFYGEESQLVPQRLLGSAVSYLHSRPLLTRKMIEDAISTVDYVTNSDLADQVEKVKFSPLSFNLEELSKLWSVFFQTPYVLSTAYRASLVLIEAEEVTQQALPVRARGVTVRPFRHPVIEAITSEPTEDEPNWADQPILAGHTLVITGKQLRGDVTRVRIGRIEVEPETIHDTQIAFPLTLPPLPAGSLGAGMQAVQIVQHLLMGDPPEPHRGVESNLAAFVLRSTVTHVEALDSSAVQVTFDPAVEKTQRVVLLLNELNPPSERSPNAYRFDAPKNNGITDESVTETIQISFPISGVASGQYLVRVQVDGAESPLEVGPDGRYSGPQVTIP